MYAKAAVQAHLQWGSLFLSSCCIALKTEINRHMIAKELGTLLNCVLWAFWKILRDFRGLLIITLLVAAFFPSSAHETSYNLHKTGGWVGTAARWLQAVKTLYSVVLLPFIQQYYCLKGV